MNGLKVRIIKNFKGRVHPVTEVVALHNVDLTPETAKAFAELQQDGLIEVKKLNIALPGFSPVWKKLYTLTFAGQQTNVGLTRIK